MTKLPSFVGIILNHHKDPYQKTRIEWKVGVFFFFVAHLLILFPKGRYSLPLHRMLVGLKETEQNRAYNLLHNYCTCSTASADSLQSVMFM